MNRSLTGPAMAPAASNDVQSVLLAIRALGREPVIVQFLQARPSPHSPSGDAIVLPVCVRQADELRRMRSSGFNLVRRVPAWPMLPPSHEMGERIVLPGCA